MTVFLRPGCITYTYDFWWKKKRYWGSTGQTNATDAQLVEADIKLKLRRKAGGVDVFDPKDTPRFEDWALVYMEYQREFIDRPDVVERTLKVCLEFWGAEPDQPSRDPAVASKRTIDRPYHDLHLGDPIADPDWLYQFEKWIDARRVGGSTRNTYLSVMSGLYRVALQPMYRKDSGISTNPFRDIRRSAQGTRTIALDAATIIRWIQEASYHVALTATIAALAPKLRLGTILGLKWKDHVDLERRTITVARHKTSRRTGLPQLTPISDQLFDVLTDARDRQPTSATHVVTWRGKPVGSIKKAAERATTAIGLQWDGRTGVTFHTIRHSIATLLAEMGIAEAIRKELMGHKEIRTSQKYTHLAHRVQVAPHEQLSAQLPMAAIVVSKPRPKAKRATKPQRRTA